MSRTVIEGCAVATVDAAGTEYATGHLVIDSDRIAAVGPGPAAGVDPSVRRVDGTGCLATPGLVNTHHHLYQWATRGLAQQRDLFGWLTELYPVWAGIDEQVVAGAAAAALGWLALSGCTTTTDHHYVFPKGGGDLLAAEIDAAREVGLRFHPCRGSMDLGASAGGLPPDEIVEDTDAALAATADAVDRFHDPAPGAMLRVAVAPCSPFSVTGTLMREAAALARDKGVRLHTHLAETVQEEAYCREVHGCTPVQYAQRLGWLGPDVWLAHAVHVGRSGVDALAATGTGVAYCPSSNARLGAGIAPARALLDAGVPVGLGVDGAASQEASHLGAELRQALLMARVGPPAPGDASTGPGGAATGAAAAEPGAPEAPGPATAGPAAFTARQALALGTIGGARCLGRDDELGSLEPGKLADVALWRLDGLGHAGIDDPVAALVLGPPAPLALLLVAGRPVVSDGVLSTVDERELARRARQARLRLRRAGER